MFVARAPAYVFWFCNLVVIFLAIACFQRSSTMFYFLISAGILFETPWILDWANFLLTGNSLLSITSYYAETPLYYLILTFVRHIATVPLAIGILFFLKSEKINLKAVCIWAAAVIVTLTLSYFVGGAQNINCTHKFCIPLNDQSISGPFYQIIWLILTISIPSLAAFFVISPFHRWLEKKKSHLLDIRSRETSKS